MPERRPFQELAGNELPERMGRSRTSAAPRDKRRRLRFSEDQNRSDHSRERLETRASVEEASPSEPAAPARSNGPSLRDQMAAIFYGAQSSLATHRKHINNLYRLLKKTLANSENASAAERAFGKEIALLLLHVLSAPKGHTLAQRTILFVAAFFTFAVSEDAKAEALVEDADASSSSAQARYGSAHRLVIALLAYLASGTLSREAHVRYRTFQLSALLLSAVRELDERSVHKYTRAFLNASLDKIPVVRIQAALGLAKLLDFEPLPAENPVDPGTSDALDFMEGPNAAPFEDHPFALRLLSLLEDPAAEVRRASAMVIALVPALVPFVMERLRDVDVTTRRTVMQYTVRNLAQARKLRPRDEFRILKLSLDDRDDTVRANALTFLLTSCAAHGNVHGLLSMLDLRVDTHRDMASRIIEVLVLDLRSHGDAAFADVQFDPADALTCFIMRVRLEALRRLEAAAASASDVAFAQNDMSIPELAPLVDAIEAQWSRYQSTVAPDLNTVHALAELLDMARLSDSPDDIARRRLARLVQGILAHRQLARPLIGPSLDLLLTTTTPVELTRITVEIVQSLRDDEHEHEQVQDQSHASSDSLAESSNDALGDTSIRTAAESIAGASISGSSLAGMSSVDGQENSQDDDQEDDDEFSPPLGLLTPAAAAVSAILEDENDQEPTQPPSSPSQAVSLLKRRNAEHRQRLASQLNATDAQCLKIIRALLERLYSDLDKTTMSGVFQELIIPATKVPDTEMRHDALASLALYGLLDADVARDLLSLFFQMAKEDRDTEVALTAIFDIFLTHGADLLQTPDYALSFIRYALDVYQGEALLIAVEGTLKLVLSGTIAHDVVVHDLIILFFYPENFAPESYSNAGSPATDRYRTALLQALAYFFPAFAFSSQANQITIAKLAMRVISGLLKIYNDDAIPLPTNKILAHIVHWTDPAALIDPPATSFFFPTSHVILAHDMLAFILSRHDTDPPAFRRSFVSALSHVAVPSHAALVHAGTSYFKQPYLVGLTLLAHAARSAFPTNRSIPSFLKYLPVLSLSDCDLSSHVLTADFKLLRSLLKDHILVLGTLDDPVSRLIESLFETVPQISPDVSSDAISE